MISRPQHRYTEIDDQVRNVPGREWWTRWESGGKVAREKRERESK